MATSVQDDKANSVNQMHGISKHIKPNPAGFVAEAAVRPICCSCCCCSCPVICDCVSGEAVKRSYMRLYENRLEINNAWTLATMCCFCACAPKGWVRDSVTVYYFDQPPTTTGTYFPLCCPCDCLGRPLVWSFQTKCCCGCCDSDEILGWTFCDCCVGCNFLCCNGTLCGRPVTYAFPMKNGRAFLSAYKAAYESYADKRGIKKAHQARFFTFDPSCCCLKKEEVPTNAWDTSAAKKCEELMGVEMEEMVR